MDQTAQQKLATLIELGFEEQAAAEALNHVQTVEQAVEWMLSGQQVRRPSLASLELTLTAQDMEEDSESSSQAPDYSLKMVLVVRTDLGMSAGKIAAQCVHAALGAYRVAKLTTPGLLQSWEYSGEKAVCVKCKSEAEIEQLRAAADAMGVTNYLVVDAGRTQIEEGSKTVLAVGPAHEDLINQVTGSLKLY